MFYSLKTDCYYRHYGTIGHIVRPIVSMEEVVDESGAIFLDQLSYQAQEIDEIAMKLSRIFCDADPSDLKNDALEFYSRLAEDGFLNFSKTLSNFEESGFDYSTLNGKMTQNIIKAQLEESSSTFLSNYFMANPFLETFHIELTSKCNERCIHCYIPHEYKDTDIEPELMYSTLNQCKELGVLTIVFSGGEPMQHPNFCEFLRYAKDLDFNVTVLSNLTLLNDEILDALKYRHASCVNVSLYSMDPDVHDAITTIKNSFAKTKNNILTLINNNVPVQINCPVMKQNKDSFYEVVNWGQEHKCSVITDYLIMARYDQSIDNLDNHLTTDDLEPVINKLLEKDAVFQINAKAAQVDAAKARPANPDEKVCGVGMSTLCMVASGKVYPCAGWQKFICGDLKQETLKHIWDDSPQVNYLRKLRQKDFSQCLGCEDWDYCHMCMARNSNEDPDGSIFNIPPITCEAAHICHKVIMNYQK